MIGIAIPFGGDDPRRRRLFEYVVSRWEHLLPKARIATGAGGAPFNRCVARNDAVRQLEGCDAIIIADADTIFPAQQVAFALETVQRGRWGFLFETYYNLTEAATAPLLADPTIEPTGITTYDYNFRIENSPSACMVCMREDYWAAGGFDERFDWGWGWDDNAARIAFSLVLGPPFRVPGVALHLWHDPGDGFSSPGIAKNHKIYMEYEEQTHATIQDYLAKRAET